MGRLMGNDVELAAEIAALANERIRVINANRERMIEAWIAETGLLPAQSELVEQHHRDGTITVHVRRRQATLDSRLIACAPDALALLRELPSHARGACPWCYGSERHFEGCKLAALLARIDGTGGTP